MALVQYPWRKKWGVASFRGAKFHVDTSTQGSGRRIALHEFPKRNQGYAEDMGRRQRRRTIEGYLVGPYSVNDQSISGAKSSASAIAGSDYTKDRDRLIKALEDDGPGTLDHPLLGSLTVVVDQYSVIESRERGGYCTFAMTFIEAGGKTGASEDTQAVVNSSAGAVESSAATMV